MMVLGKKCPACGGNQLSVKSSTAKIAAVPGAKTFMCTECKQQIVNLFSFSIGVENRNYVRKKLPPNILVRIQGSSDQFARIKNISEGGICFDHHYGADPINSRFLFLDLYNCNDGTSLEQLSAEIVATSEQLLDINGIKSTVLNNSARFVNLNQAQKKVLFSCINQYGTL